MSDDSKRLIKRTILDDETFIQAVFGGRRHGRALPWDRVVLRPVLLKQKRHVQFSYFNARKDITKNYSGPELVEKLDELMALPFSSVALHTTDGDVQIQITRRGKAIVHQHQVPGRREMPSLAHDRHKNLLLPADSPDPFLQVIGVMTEEGKVRAHMQKKFRQINEFLRRMVETGELEQVDHDSLLIVDCGCGSAHLTFAAYHYLNHVLNVPTRLIGVDVDEELVRQQSEQGRALGWDGISFQVSTIIDFRPATPPDVVLALHACDTATDEALAQSIRWRSRMIFSAPCCHRDLQRQVDRRPAPAPFAPVLQHAVLKERLGDVLTDAFRALILRVMGYRTDIVEFVSTEHTGKNLMIRAVRSGRPGDPKAVAEYKALREFWHVEPYLECLLESELGPFLTEEID